MSRYTGSTWKLSRRCGYSTLETGKELVKRPYAPGPHGKDKKKKVSEYGKQLNEKQKIRYIYGVSEKQFRRLFRIAKKTNGVTGEEFLKILESRLDNLVYKMSLARTRRLARQLVNHGHILVDGKKVDIASYRVKPGQVVALREKSKNLAIVKASLEGSFTRKEYVSFNENEMSGSLVRLPERDEFLKEINEQLIVEFYNR